MLKAFRELASRIKQLEAEVEKLKVQLATPQGGPWWKQIVGEFKGDKMFAEIARAGRRIRRADRQEVR
jgi:hypothetical protein